MKTTPNYDLALPGSSDLYDIESLIENFSILDEALEGVKVRFVTQAEYDALAAKNDKTVYFVDGTKMFLGDNQIGGGGSSAEISKILYLRSGVNDIMGVPNRAVPGINLLRNTQSYYGWVPYPSNYRLDVSADGVVTLSNSGATANQYSGAIQWIGSGLYDDLKGKTITISFEVMSDDWDSVIETDTQTKLNAFAFQIGLCANAPNGSSTGDTGAYLFTYLGNTDYVNEVTPVNGKWLSIVSKPILIDDNVFNYDQTLIGDPYNYFIFQFMLRRNGTVYFRNPKIEIV